ncbi:hypothetical protein JXA84_09735 [candidate division WOR-3 bacterium]|nr:hypothetical protein [candidate division WOR-3 bacterium]
MRFIFCLTVLTVSICSVAHGDTYESFDGWRRFKTAEYFWGKGFSRLSLFEISWGKIDHKLGRGLGVLDLFWLDENQEATNTDAAYVFLPLQLYAAFPLGETPRFKTYESGPGKIVIIPREGMFQYTACFFFNASFSFVSFCDHFKEFALSYRFSAAFEKSLPFQNFVCLEAGLFGLFLPNKQKNENFLYAGISIGVLSNWKRIDI